MDIDIRPTTDDVETATDLIRSAYDEVAERFPTGTDVAVELKWGSRDFLINQMDGVAGFARYPNRIEITFNTTTERWKDAIRASVVHEYAHVWDYEQRGQKWEYRWQYVLGEALAQHLAEQLIPAYDAPWRTEHSPEDVEEHWDDLKQNKLDVEMKTLDGDWDPVFINKGDGDYPN